MTTPQVNDKIIITLEQHNVDKETVSGNLVRDSYVVDLLYKDRVSRSVWGPALNNKIFRATRNKLRLFLPCWSRDERTI